MIEDVEDTLETSDINPFKDKRKIRGNLEKRMLQLNNGKRVWQENRLMTRMSEYDQDSKSKTIENRHRDDEYSQYALPEDMRISKLLRRLCAESNVDNAINLCEKLKVVILDSSNANYIRRAFDILSDSLISVLQDGPAECQYHVAQLFGLMGYVIRNDFEQYKTWICKIYKSYKNLRVLMMYALLETFRMDIGHYELKEDAPLILETLKDMLEKSDVASVFIAITNVISQMSKNYPSEFEVHFTDIVDIMVGWHLETEQPNDVKRHCANVLQDFRPYWQKDIKFTIKLLDQFLEDVAACGHELQSDSITDIKASVVVFDSFVGAFNTVLKCLDLSVDKSVDMVVFMVGKEFLLESFQKIIQVGQIALEMFHEEELTMSLNELIVLILDCYNFRVQSALSEIQVIIKMQIDKINYFSDEQTLSLLMVIIKCILVLKTKIPLSFMQMLLNQESLLLSKRFSKCEKIQKSLIKMYHEILDLKNVELLQQAYLNVLQDLNYALCILFGSKITIAINDNTVEDETELEMKKKYSISQAQFVVIFNLQVLSNLATSSTSILALYALKPTILELLSQKLLTTDILKWTNYPSVHFAILNLIAAHCKNNNNFIASSSLIKNATTTGVFSRLNLESPSESPTSDHFEMILNFISNIISKELCHNRLKVILDWCHQLIIQAASHATILKHNKNFNSIIQSINKISIESEESIVLLCANCVDALFSFETIDTEILMTISEICCIHICSNNEEICGKYSCLFSKLPLSISLQQVNNFTGLAKERSHKIKELQQWQQSSSSLGGMWPQYFKEFLNRISFNKDAESIEEYIKEIFRHCWITSSGTADEFSQAAVHDIRCLISWAQWEAAQYCVNNKLRTIFGKPQETFLRIEGIIKQDARILDLKEKSTVRDVKTLLANQRHARVLLGFLEALEKAIYNAAEGTAFALLPPEKPARTFFRINAPTCNEWFNRIRTAVDLVALHCMEPEMVIRYSEVILKNLVAKGNTSEPLFEHTLMSLAWALLRNGESDALHGLYTWTKTVAKKRFYWVKMAAEQAAGHLESAADGYIQMLETNNESKLDNHIRDFIFDQMVQSLLFLGNYQELYNFLLIEESRPVPRATIPIITITSEQVKSILLFDQTEEIIIENMCSWDILKENSETHNNFSYHNMISLVENTLFDIFLRDKAFSEYDKTTCYQIIHSCLQESLRTQSKEHLNHLVILNHICHKIISQRDSNQTEDIRSLCVEKIYGSVTLSRLLCWSELFDREQQNIEMHLDVISMARKEGNLKTCRKEIEKYFSKLDFASKTDQFGKLTIEHICDQLIESSTSIDTSMWTEDMSRAVYEISKWLFCFPEKRETAIQFASASSLGICKRISESQSESPVLRERTARILLTISEWTQYENEKTVINFKQESPFTKLVTMLPDVMSHPDIEILPSISNTDKAVGKLVSYAVKQCPDLPKAWSALGAWCYRWGRKLVELRNENDQKAGLRASDISAIMNLIPNATIDDIDRVVAVLNEHQVSVEDEEIGPNETSSTELIENHLRTVPILADHSRENLHAMISIWRQAHKHVYGYYEISADAYFKYLQLVCSGNKDISDDSSTVTATLRLLRLIVKHALGLQEVLEEGLATTPTSPWKVIIPQLFSRLNHHEPYVRQRVSELLCRVAKDSPHMIIFPAVVGAAQRIDIADISMVSTFGEENSFINADGSDLTNCFNSLLDTLSMQEAETVSQVQLLVRELQRVTMLWDEMWCVSLTQVYVECAKRFNNFENELQRTNIEGDQIKKNEFSDKYQILIRPIIFAMERLSDISSRKPETNHEKMFQERYTKIIEETIGMLKKPFNENAPTEAWQKFKSFYIILQQRAQKRSSYSLKMMDISPVLGQLKNTAISMPGVENNNEHHHVYIKCVENIVHILPTKTKPKKLAFYGSDGRRYTYLFKGLEDLHLDERIMQFLSIANSMMSEAIDCNGKVIRYRARHYSVIPLGPRSGLISWVDGVLPIFALYKKWQQRKASDGKKDGDGIVMRPSELYFSKLTPLLAEQKIKITDPRKEWPLPVLRKVLTELSNETPRDLLAKEFWCHSTTAVAWRQVIRNYSLSVAVMSVIGYIIGLGDRHLDNVLVELASGEVVHIDYNVCFEKGKTLRVPEKIPFRMTQNLEEALGVTGIEGSFRLACETVLKALKKGRETLLTLLEAFVYDPLVDWAVGDDGPGAGLTAFTTTAESKQLKKRFRNEMTLDNLAIRLTEITPDWNQNKNEVSQQLQLMKFYLETLECKRTDLLELENERQILIEELALVKEASTEEDKHQLYTLPQRYDVYKRTKDELDTVQSALLQKCNHSERHIESYMVSLQNIKEIKIMEYLQDLEYLNTENVTPSEFILIKDFLENSAQIQLYLQCEQLAAEMSSSSVQQMTVIKQTFDVLLQYGAVVKYFPQSHREEHRFAKYTKWCKYLLENPTISTCHDIADQITIISSDATLISNSTNQQQIIAFMYQLQTILQDANYQYQKTYERIQDEYKTLEEIEKKYEMAKINLLEFIVKEPEAVNVLHCSTISALTDLMGHYLFYENAILSSGNDIVELMIYNPNDDHFLDDLYMYTFIFCEICDIIPNIEQFSNVLNCSIECLKESKNVYNSLRKGKYNFLNNIIPDTIEGIISEDQSILDMISIVSNLQPSCINLTELLAQLNHHLQCVSMNIPSPNAASYDVALEIQNKLNTLTLDYEMMNVKNIGENVFLAFNGLFNDLQNEYKNVISSIEKLTFTISEMDNIELINSSQETVNLIFNQSTRPILELIFIVKRLEAMIEFFTLTLQMACAFKGTGVCTVYDNDLLSNPIKKFISDYIRYMLMGLGSYCMSLILCGLLYDYELNKQNIHGFKESNQKKIDALMKTGNVTSTTHNRAMNICNTINIFWKKKFTLKYLQEIFQSQKNGIKRNQLIMAAHYWLHEEILSGQTNAVNLVSINRTNLLLQLGQCTQKLTSWKTSIQKIREEMAVLVEIVLQRLKWAVGANPALAEMANSFENALNIRAQKLEKQAIFSEIALKSSVSVLNYETLRLNTPESREQDQQLLNIVSRWEKSCMMSQSCVNVVSPVELAIITLLEPEAHIDQCWLMKVTSLMADHNEEVQQKLQNIEKTIVISQDNLQMCAHKLRALMSNHHKLISDVRSLLKLTLKMDGNHQNPIKEYLLKYKKFINLISELHGNVLSKDFTELVVKEILHQISEILPNVEHVYDDLFLLKNILKEYEENLLDNAAEMKIKPDNEDNLQTKILKSENQTEQKRNAYAVSVWRRIRMKLEGRDPDPTRRSSVQEQVDWMIKEAMNPDNLAVLYEGWTPWV